MKRKYKAEFNGFMKKTPGWALKLSDIKNEGNVTIAREGTVNLTKTIGYLGKLEEGDIIQFYAEIKGISFEYPQNVTRTNKKNEAEKRDTLRKYFDIEEKNP